jgi:nitrate/nitrite-specific signal transduction histidine kinase
MSTNIIATDIENSKLSKEQIDEFIKDIDNMILRIKNKVIDNIENLQNEEKTIDYMCDVKSLFFLLYHKCSLQV